LKCSGHKARGGIRSRGIRIDANGGLKWSDGGDGRSFLLLVRPSVSWGDGGVMGEMVEMMVKVEMVVMEEDNEDEENEEEEEC